MTNHLTARDDEEVDLQAAAAYRHRAGGGTDIGRNIKDVIHPPVPPPQPPRHPPQVMTLLHPQVVPVHQVEVR